MECSQISPRNFDNKVTGVSQLNLEADESEMVACYTTSTTNSEETAEGNIDETEEIDNTEQDEQRVDIVECKKRLREAYETILMYKSPLDDLDQRLLYKEQKLTMSEVMANVSCFTSFFEKKSALSFAKWCYKRKLALTESKESRKVVKGNSGSKLKFYTLYVLEKELMNSVCSSIINYLPAYKAHIIKLKDDGFQVIGYARKSPGEESEEVRIRLLQTMVDRLYERSLVDEVFVSPCSKASDPMKARDLKVNEAILKRISRVRGTTQGE
ncbi:hypothetical protein G6F43_012094 [Rhizopus delemar]|nr:hypothetical protein G6F43_012094 [Rhizopus delemar]